MENHKKFNSDNEYIFFKVFNNKYLLKKIINEIESMGYHETDFREIDDIKRKIKFKNIKLLSWMLDKCQFELLLCKLKANEEIVITSGDSIINFLKIYEKNHN
ncbi:hypothetical protein DICPUDRAFT_30324, partial [Dictyostelium purpureum]